MAGSRINDLTKSFTVSELQSLLSTLCFVLDDPSLDEAGKLMLTRLLTSSAVTSADNNYQALTPRGFYSSQATTALMGIVKLATEYTVGMRSTTDVLTPSLLDTIFSSFKSAWTMRNGYPNFHLMAGSTCVGGGALAWQAVWKGDLPISNTTGIQLNPVLEDGVELDNGYCMVVIKSDTDRERVLEEYYYITGEFTRNIGDHFALNISSDHKRLFFKTRSVDQTNVRISITANFTTRDAV